MGQRRLLVLGVGNLLLSDEGVGIHVIRALEQCDLPPVVSLIDGGTGGESLLFEFEGFTHLIVVDAVDAGGNPGTLYRFTVDDLELERDGAMLSAHDTSFMDVCRLAMLRGCLPETVVLAVQVGSIGWGLDLSPEVEAAVPRVIEAVKSEIDAMLR